MTVAVRFRDAFKKYTVGWLSERPNQLGGKTAGYRVLWAMIAPLDAAAEFMVQSLQAPWPGKGTPTALPWIGRSRGMVRSQGETDDEYGGRMATWLERARELGSMLATARALHEFLENRPRVRIFNRAGACIEVAETTGDVTRYAPDPSRWDWDSISNPERASFWWDEWIVVYPSEWADTGLWGDGRAWGARDSGIGHQVTRKEIDAVRGIVDYTKAAQTNVRAIVWTSDAALFDPTDPMTCPDGYWGLWSKDGGGGSRVASRNTTTCRYWDNR